MWSNEAAGAAEQQRTGGVRREIITADEHHHRLQADHARRGFRCLSLKTIQEETEARLFSVMANMQEK